MASTHSIMSARARNAWLDLYKEKVVGYHQLQAGDLISVGEDGHEHHARVVGRSCHGSVYVQKRMPSGWGPQRRLSRSHFIKTIWSQGGGPAR